MKLPDIKQKILKELEELYDIPRVRSFRYEVSVSVDEIPTVCYSVEKIMNINN